MWNDIQFVLFPEQIATEYDTEANKKNGQRDPWPTKKERNTLKKKKKIETNAMVVKPKKSCWCDERRDSPLASGKKIEMSETLNCGKRE